MKVRPRKSAAVPAGVAAKPKLSTPVASKPPLTEQAARHLLDPGLPHRRNILLVDDHPIFCEGLSQSLGREPDLAVCGEAPDASQALEAVGRLRPDLVIVDITLPGKSGLELIKDLRALYPSLPMLAVSMHEESLYAARILRAGARGYVMKQEPPQTLLRAIRQVLDGGIYVSQRMSAQILETFSGQRPATSRSPIETLTDREFEIFHLVGQGRQNHEIADQLHLTLKTVVVHQGNIRKKLQLQNSADLLRFAMSWEEAQKGQ
jgi:DNA-binding NarL/FixJ family response regulator